MTPLTMRRYQGHAPSTDPRSGQQHKEAIDAIYTASPSEPEYLAILDAPDVVPHVSMINPAPDDGDPDVPSDLPYGCDTPFSRDARKNRAITRVVGRIPGIMHAARPTLLTNAMKASAEFKPRPRKDYLAYFAISAESWQKSTTRNIDTIFGKGNGNRIHISPPTMKSAANRFLSPLLHFINCHGAPHSPNFFGQRGDDYPTALHDARASPTVPAQHRHRRECCYGAKLYNPADSSKSQRSRSRTPISTAARSRSSAAPTYRLWRRRRLSAPPTI